MAIRIPLFLLIAVLIVAAGHIYLYRRLVRDTTERPGVRRAATALIVLLPTLMVARMVALVSHFSLGFWPALVVFFWMGLALYLVLTLWLIGGARRLVRAVRRAGSPAFSPERRVLFARVVAGSAAVAASAVSAYGVRTAFESPLLSEIGIRLPRLPRALDGLRIVQLSDLHVGDVLGERFVQELVMRANALKPDRVALTGDLVDGSVPQLGRTIGLLGGIQSRYGTYVCTGNHEFYSGDVAWCEALDQMGMPVLRNRRVAIGDAGGSFDLVGVDDWGQRLAKHGRGYDLPKAIAGRDAERASVLLAHQPFSFEETAKAGLGLQLSGHTHGGQLFPNTLVLSLAYQFTVGHYTLGDSHLYVNRGAGFWGPPMRVGSPPEIVAVTLMAA